MGLFLDGILVDRVLSECKRGSWDLCLNREVRFEVRSFSRRYPFLWIVNCIL